MEMKQQSSFRPWKTSCLIYVWNSKSVDAQELLYVPTIIQNLATAASANAETLASIPIIWCSKMGVWLSYFIWRGIIFDLIWDPADTTAQLLRSSGHSIPFTLHTFPKGHYSAGLYCSFSLRMTSLEFNVSVRARAAILVALGRD